MKKEEITPNYVYLFEHPRYKAIVRTSDKASRDDHSIYGTPLKVIKNNSLWHDGVLALEYKFFIEAYTQETHPEYYL